jgi:hypothetical protein
MIPEQIRKRDAAWLGLAVCLFLHFGIALLSAWISDTLESDLRHTVMHLGVFLIPALLCFVALIFWFKGHYHWSKAKGHDDGLAGVAVLGFPLGPILLYRAPDKSPPPLIDPATRRACPSCHAPYLLEDYDPSAPEIFCSSCGASLPRE